MVEIRRIKKNEYQQARELISSIMHAEYRDDVETFPMSDLDDINFSYGKIGEAFFVGVDGKGNVIGTVGIKKEDERTAFLRRIFVDPKCRRKKVGSKLIDRALSFCREAGYQEVVFKTTSRMEAAIKLCISKGFSEKAKVNLGGVGLLKFAYFVKENSPLAD